MLKDAWSPKWHGVASYGSCAVWTVNTKTSCHSLSSDFQHSNGVLKKNRSLLNLLTSHLWYVSLALRDVIRREVCRVGFDQRNPKPETDSEDLTSPGPIETRNPKPKTRNRLWKLTFPRTDRNPKPETRNRLWRLNFTRTDRNPKPETRNSKPETRNLKPTVKVGFELRNPKPETRNPKPTLKT